MPSKKRSWFKKIRRKKKKTEKTVFGEPIKNKKKKKRSFIEYLKNTGGNFRKKLGWFVPKRKFHLRYFLKIKRWAAAVISLFFLATAITLFPNQISLLFFVSFYIFIDYIWKTRRIDWTKEE